MNRQDVALDPRAPSGSANGRTLEELQNFHRAMVMSRSIELACIEKSGHWYPSIGEEGIVIGVFSQLRADDAALPHYRGALVVPWLRGRSLVQVMACIIQTRLSPSCGRLYGSFAGGIELGVMPFITNVLGPNIAVATGMALSYKLRSQDRVAVVAFGDGTSGTGDFHESLNMGNALGAPVVYVCQNNGYSISTPVKVSLACTSIADWASRYGMPAATVDGNDVLAVANAVKAGIDRARSGNGPSFIEARTMRRSGHFWADPAKYMSPGQTRDWEAEDPIRRLEEVMLGIGATRDELKRVWSEAASDVARAVEEASAGDPLTALDLGIEEVIDRVR